MNDTKSARRYARAILETAPQPAPVREELAVISSAVRSNRELAEALTHPGIPAEMKKAIAKEVFRDLSAPLPRMLDMLIDSSRIELIHEIAEKYRQEWNAKNNVHAARVVSAMPLDDADRASVMQAIEKAVSGTVELVATTDPTLIGGLKVEVDGLMFDGTVKARLQALRQHLL